MAGYPDRPEWQQEQVARVESVDAALSGAAAVIAPMTGVDEGGFIRAVPDGRARLRLSESCLRQLPAGTPFLIGTARPPLRDWVTRAGLRLIELAELDEIAILNSIPTAEGAIYLAMGELPITLWQARAVVVGFGRTGVTLARKLRALDAITTVVARNRAERARAREMGLIARPFEELAEVAADCHVLFNTVPAFVITSDVLGRMTPGTLVIDIASAPGGTDFTAAQKLGIPAILALGLPGKVAPKTAGRILAETVPGLLAELLSTAGR